MILLLAQLAFACRARLLHSWGQHAICADGFAWTARLAGVLCVHLSRAVAKTVIVAAALVAVALDPGSLFFQRTVVILCEGRSLPGSLLLLLLLLLHLLLERILMMKMVLR